MGRLSDFDYTRPLFYMVTLQAVEGAAPFSGIARDASPGKDSLGRVRYLLANDFTYAFARAIKGFAAARAGLWPIETFIVMPDHLHILFHLREGGPSLVAHVEALVAALEKEYWRVLQNSGMQNSDGQRRPAIPLPAVAHQSFASQSLASPAHQSFANLANGFASRPPVFRREWHDWIVKKENQLAAFTRYIRENPKRAWLRRRNRRYFLQVGRVLFAGREWFAYGNKAILDLPVIEPFRCSRKWRPDGAEWEEALCRAGRTGPGGAGIGTFMSPCEKECGNAIYRAGGSIVVLSPEGFGARWHPPRNKEALCAKGRMLFLSLWEPSAAKPDNATLYRRCHEMGDIIVQNRLQNTGLQNTGLQNSDGQPFQAFQASPVSQSAHQSFASPAHRSFAGTFASQ